MFILLWWWIVSHQYLRAGRLLLDICRVRLLCTCMCASIVSRVGQTTSKIGGDCTFAPCVESEKTINKHCPHSHIPFVFFAFSSLLYFFLFLVLFPPLSELATFISVAFDWHADARFQSYGV